MTPPEFWLIVLTSFLTGTLVGAFAVGTIVVLGFMEQERRRESK